MRKICYCGSLVHSFRGYRTLDKSMSKISINYEKQTMIDPLLVQKYLDKKLVTMKTHSVHTNLTKKPYQKLQSLQEAMTPEERLVVHNNFCMKDHFDGIQKSWSIDTEVYKKLPYPFDYFNHLIELEKRINITFDNRAILMQAMMAPAHAHMVNTNPQWRFLSNERLEFLGDVLFETQLTLFLMGQFPNYRARDMEYYRAMMRSNEYLGKLGMQKYNIHHTVLIHNSVPVDRARSICADALEALVGAIGIDQGLKKVNEFINVQLLPDLLTAMSQANAAAAATTTTIKNVGGLNKPLS